jgi:putative PIN family toxin of toxin-antitoxin system
MADPVEQKKHAMDVVFDANVVVSGLRSSRGASFSLLQMIRTGNPAFRLHLSTAVVLEYEEVLLREFVPGRFCADAISKFLDDLVAASTRHAQVKSLRPVSSDPDDDTLIELAITADVQAVITHNVRHFSKVPGFGIDLLTPGQLLQKYRT